MYYIPFSNEYSNVILLKIIINIFQGNLLRTNNEILNA